MEKENNMIEGGRQNDAKRAGLDRGLGRDGAVLPAAAALCCSVVLLFHSTSPVELCVVLPPRVHCGYYLLGFRMTFLHIMQMRYVVNKP